ncbi:putative quinol monooxygenase [Streptomyces sp. NPDC088350]|uniref:putative quinol monooxygenase n=1 Tax=Streptomyces sp. NPDC088350 TaxID=3365854 RepID=UPI0037FC0999
MGSVADHRSAAPHRSQGVISCTAAPHFPICPVAGGDRTIRTGAVVAVSTMEPRNGRREDLLEVLADLAPRIRAEPGCLHYSVHRARGDTDGPLLVIQMFASIEAFTEHSASVADQIPRIAALLATPPVPPTLFEPVPRSALVEGIDNGNGEKSHAC